MLNLIRLEFKKFKFRGSWLGFLIANAAIMGLVALMVLDPEIRETESALLTYPDALFFIDTMVRAAFIIYASVLLTKFVIDEYKNKTISVMFTYPINRKKLMAAKLIIVFVWTFLAIILSNILVGGALLVINKFAGVIPGSPEAGMLADHAVRTLLNAAAAAGLSLIPLFFGMWKKSGPGTIVSAVLIVAVVNSSSGGFSLYSIIAIPLTLAAIGIFIGYLAIRNVDKADLV